MRKLESPRNDEAEQGSPSLVDPWSRDALQNLPDGVVVLDAAARLLYANAAARALIGIRPQDTDDWTARGGIFQPDERTPVPMTDLPAIRALHGLPTNEIEIFVKNEHVAGVHVLASARPLRAPSGEVCGAVCLFHDLTQRRAGEAQVREAERQRRAILDSIPDIAWLKDRDGRFIAVNRRFAESVGRDHPEDVIGLTDYDVAPRALADQYRRDDAETMAAGGSKTVEEPFAPILPGSQPDIVITRWIETIKTCIVDEDGQVFGTAGIARDVTERRRKESILQNANDELERRVEERTLELREAQESLVRKERLAALGQLAGGVAHQIRNPLAAIMNATYVLRRHMIPGQHPHVEDAIRIIHDEVRHANVIITSLLDYARVRAPDRHPLSVVEVLERVLHADWIPKNIEIDRDIEDVPPIAADGDQLHSAFFNIIRNAVEAMPLGGSLRVEVRTSGDHVVLGFADSGAGISPQVRGHLFEPLHSTKPLGIGLGLVTARTFIEAHNGRIYSVDVPFGARFEVRLPLSAGPSSPRPAPRGA